MASQFAVSREDNKVLFDVRKVLMLDDKHLRRGLEELASTIEAGKTKEDIVWVEKKVRATSPSTP